MVLIPAGTLKRKKSKISTVAQEAQKVTASLKKAQEVVYMCWLGLGGVHSLFIRILLVWRWILHPADNLLCSSKKKKNMKDTHKKCLRKRTAFYAFLQSEHFHPSVFRKFKTFKVKRVKRFFFFFFFFLTKQSIISNVSIVWIVSIS